jgi:hypothetical protein
MLNFELLRKITKLGEDVKYILVNQRPGQPP